MLLQFAHCPLSLSGRTYFTFTCVSTTFLWFSSPSDRAEVYLGGENSLSLTFNARNEGEGGAYEAELYVVLPPEADYSGIARNNVVSQTTVTVTLARDFTAVSSLLLTEVLYSPT